MTISFRNGLKRPETMSYAQMCVLLIINIFNAQITLWHLQPAGQLLHKMALFGGTNDMI